LVTEKFGLRPYPCPAKSAAQTKLTSTSSSPPGAVVKEPSILSNAVPSATMHWTWYEYLVRLLSPSTKNVCVKSVFAFTSVESISAPSSHSFIVDPASLLQRAMMLMEESDTSPDWIKTSDVVMGSSSEPVDSVESEATVLLLLSLLSTMIGVINFSYITLPSMPISFTCSSPVSETDACPNDCNSFTSGARLAQRS